MLKLSTNIFDWDDVFTHISEFVRIDEHLRLKQVSLETISPECHGWTYLAGCEVTEHKRILNNMRCFLLYHAKEIWGYSAAMFSKTEYEKIKNFEDLHYTLYEGMPEFNAISNGDQFWFLMVAIDDKEATNKFFRFMVEKFYNTNEGHFISGMHKNEITQNILSKCHFSLP